MCFCWVSLLLSYNLPIFYCIHTVPLPPDPYLLFWRRPLRGSWSACIAPLSFTGCRIRIGRGVVSPPPLVLPEFLVTGPSVCADRSPSPPPPPKRENGVVRAIEH